MTPLAPIQAVAVGAVSAEARLNNCDSPVADMLGGVDGELTSRSPFSSLRDSRIFPLYPADFTNRTEPSTAHLHSLEFRVPQRPHLLSL